MRLAARLRRRPRATPPGDLRLLEPGTEANVDALLDTVRWLLAEEDQRDQSFNTRGVGLAGFVGIVISVSLALAHNALATDWAAPWKGISVTLFGVALACFLTSVTVVIIGVLRPRESASLGMDDVQKFPLPEWVYKPKVISQGTIMRGLIEALLVQRGRAENKATWLHRGYWSLLAGLAALSTLGFIVALHEAKLIGVNHARRPAQPAAAACRAHPRSCGKPGGNGAGRVTIPRRVG